MNVWGRPYDVSTCCLQVHIRTRQLAQGRCLGLRMDPCHQAYACPSAPSSWAAYAAWSLAPCHIPTWLVKYFKTSTQAGLPLGYHTHLVSGSGYGALVLTAVSRDTTWREAGAARCGLASSSVLGF